MIMGNMSTDFSSRKRNDDITLKDATFNLLNSIFSWLSCVIATLDKGIRYADRYHKGMFTVLTMLIIAIGIWMVKNGNLSITEIFHLIARR